MISETQKKLRNILFSVFIIIFSIPAYFPQMSCSAQGIPVKIKETAENHHVITLEYGNRTNTGLFSGKEGLLVFDTGHPGCEEPLRNAITETAAGRISYIINTHAHGDHISSNAIGKPDAVIINRNNLDALCSENIIQKRKNPLQGLNGKEFDDVYQLRFNNEEILLIPETGIHSDSDILIYFPVSGCVYTGDILLSESFPAASRKVPEYMKFLDKMTGFFPDGTVFIPGHGKTVNGDFLPEYREMLRSAIKIVTKSMREGKSREQAIEEDILKDYHDWGLFLTFLNTGFWIKSVYRRYK